MYKVWITSNNVAWLGCMVYGRRNELNEIKVLCMYGSSLDTLSVLGPMLLHDPPNQSIDFIAKEHFTLSR